MKIRLKHLKAATVIGFGVLGLVGCTSGALQVLSGEGREPDTSSSESPPRQYLSGMDENGEFLV